MKPKFHSSSQFTTARIIRKSTKKLSKKVTKKLSKKITKNPKLTLPNSPPRSTSTTTEMIRKMQHHERLLQAAVSRAETRNDLERLTYQKLVKYYEDQQSILEVRCEMMMNNCHGYKSLVTSMQHVIITLRGRLNRFQLGNEEDETESEDDEGFCEREE